MTISTSRARVRNGRRGERGVILMLFALVLIVLLAVAGLAVDLGIAHVTMSRLTKAVDAGALSGARHSGGGTSGIQKIASQTAAANYGVGGLGAAAAYGVTVEQPAADTYRVRVKGATQAPALFSRVLGRDKIDVVSEAEATRYPLDVSLVLDLSGSLERAGAFDDLQAASKNFLEYFDDSIDQFGIVTYSTWAEQKMSMRKGFKATGKSLIDGLDAISDTNIEEGLRLGKVQLDTAPHRESALKVLVLFTDGRPTAFSDAFRLDGPNQDCAAATDSSGYNASPLDADRDGQPDCWAGAIATFVTSNGYRGLFQDTDGRKIIGFQQLAPRLTSNGSGTASPNVQRLPGGGVVDGNGIRAIGTTQSEEWAAQARAAGYTVYAVGLGNPSASHPLEQPDLDFLRRIANEDGAASGAQPKGEMLFAPSATDLDAAFSRLADRILTRLTR
jgi:Flp pilus assembly protein TadG